MIDRPDWRLPTRAARIGGQEIAYSAVDLRPPWVTGATPVVLLHGLGLSREIWRPWIAALASERRVVVIDLRGHGDSAPAWVAERYALDRFMDDVEGVADAAGLDRFHFVGESLGGTTGLGLAASSPGRLRSVTVCSTAFDGRRIGRVHHWPELVGREGGMDRWSREMIAGRLGPAAGSSPLTKWLEAAHARLAPRIVSGIVRCLEEVDLTTQLASVELPLLIVSPRRSPFVDPSNAEALAEIVPGSTLAFVPDSFHGVVLSHWQACLDHLRPFLARVDASAEPTPGRGRRTTEGSAPTDRDM